VTLDGKDFYLGHHGKGRAVAAPLDCVAQTVLYTYCWERQTEEYPMPKQRRNFSGAEKIAIPWEHLLDKVPVSEVCEQYGLQPTMFYN